MNWRFLDTGTNDGPYNMAVDEVLFERCRAGLSPPVLRVYQWKPWAISLGRMEKAEAGLDTAACERDGIPIVRRPTGGRAVYHAEELTYSFAARFGDLPVPPTVGDTYRFVAGVLVDGLRSLGVAAEIWPPGPGATRAHRAPKTLDSMRRGPCFASVSQYEICVGGKKLVGSAQRRWPEGILQHGSILTGPAHCRIERYLREGPPGGADGLASLTVTTDDLLGRRVEARELGDVLLRAARRVWGVEIFRDDLHPAEVREVEGLRERKYARHGWNRAAPAPSGAAEGTETEADEGLPPRN